ncbi:hypothetical protein [Clostridium sp. JNZ J1-5]
MAVILNTLEQVIPNPQNGDAWGITIIEDEMFVSGWYSGTTKLHVYDLKTYMFKRTLTTPKYVYSIGTDGVNLYIKNASNQIVKIDKNTGTTISTNTNITFNMGNSGSFKIDINNDRLYACDYSNKLNIFTYSTGNLIKSYTLPIATAGVEVIENQYVIVSCYTTNKIYISPITDNDILNLSFTELYVSTTKTAGIAYSNNPTAKLIVGSYDSGIYSGDIEGLANIKYLIKQNNQYYTTKSEFYPIEQDTLTKEMIDKYGSDSLTNFTNTFSTNSALMTNGGVLGAGQQFSVDLNTEMLSLNNAIIE